MRRNVWRGFLVFVMVVASVKVAGGKDFPVQIGNTKHSVIAALGEPVKTSKLEGGILALVYDDYHVFLRGGRACSITTFRNCKDTIYSLGVGAGAQKVRQIMGKPDLKTKRALYYFKNNGHVVGFYFDDKDQVKGYYLGDEQRRESIINGTPGRTCVLCYC